ncbi:YcgJ family protein [Citrobacter amalonaticus]|uniref:YcgJ family protein n=1 Tax=Citrobacter amalonaticus TaxID=35703 RepID=UPI00339D0D67
MNKNLKLMLLIMPFTLPEVAIAASTGTLYSPARGVVCDEYFCASAKEGVSFTLTKQYLSKKASDSLASQGTFEQAAFTFSNGIYCDIKVKACYKDRFFGADGKPSAPVDTAVSRILFPD